MNPDSTVNAEVVARTYIPETLVRTATPLSREQQAAQDRANQDLRAYEATKETDPIAVAVAVAKKSLSSPEQSVDISTIDTNKEVKRRIHEPETDATGTIIDDDLDKLRKAALKTAMEAKAIAENGLDGIVDTTRREEIVLFYITNVLDTRPAFSSFSDEEKRAIAENQLRLPEVRQKIAALLKQKLNPDESVQTDEDKELATKLEDKKTKKKESKAAKKKLKKINKELDELETEKEGFSPPDALGNEGVHHARIRELQGLMGPLNRGETLQRTIMGFSAYDTPEKLTVAITRVQGKMRAKDIITDPQELLVRELIQFKGNQQELADLTEKWNSLPERLKTKAKEKKDAKKDREEAQQVVSRLQKEIDELEEPRDRREQQLGRSLQTIVVDAGNQFINGENDKRLSFLQQEANERAKEARDQDSQRFWQSIGSRWETKTRTGWTEVAGQLDDDWNDALDTGDVSSRVKSMLVRPFHVGRTDTSDERARKMAEAKRIVERFKTDKDFAESVTSGYLTALIGRRLEKGDMIPIGETKLLQELTLNDRVWMEYASDYIEEKNEKDKQFKTKVESLLQKAGDPKKRLALLQEQYPDNWAAILAFLLSGKEIPKDPSWVAKIISRMPKR